MFREFESDACLCYIAILESLKSLDLLKKNSNERAVVFGHLNRTRTGT